MYLLAFCYMQKTNHVYSRFNTGPPLDPCALNSTWAGLYVGFVFPEGGVLLRRVNIGRVKQKYRTQFAKSQTEWLVIFQGLLESCSQVLGRDTVPSSPLEYALSAPRASLHLYSFFPSGKPALYKTKPTGSHPGLKSSLRNHFVEHSIGKKVV